MTSPSFGPDASIEDLAEMAEFDGKLRQKSTDEHIDLAIMYEHLREKMTFKTGERVGYGDEELDSPDVEMTGDV